MSDLSRKYTVSGNVQGVGFRASVVSFVNSDVPDIVGYVKNLKDGRVEVVAVGPADQHEKLSGFLHKGPENAQVQEVNDEEINLYSDFIMFGIKY